VSTLCRLSCLIITIFIRTTRCLLCKSHFFTRCFLTVLASESPRIFIGFHLYMPMIFREQGAA